MYKNSCAPSIYILLLLIIMLIIFQWHLGFFKTDYTPTKRGFDSFFGYWCGKEDYWDHSNNEEREWGLDFRNNTEV